jgi:hypothetical protein
MIRIPESVEAKLPPTMKSLLGAYKALATGMGYVTLLDLLKEAKRSGEYAQIREAIEKEFVAANGDCGYGYTCTRMGGDIQVVFDRE